MLKRDALDPVGCLDIGFKRLVLRNYDGDKIPFIEFVNFLIMNMKVLKVNETEVLYKHNDEWMSYERRQLQAENRAS